MSNFWDSIKETVDVLKSSVQAPSGLVLDLSSMAFGDEDFSFGKAVAATSSRANELSAPITGNNLYGPDNRGALGLLSEAAQGANWLLWNGASEPSATVLLAFQHATQEGASKLFDSHTWSESYRQAQHTSFGEAVSFGVLDNKDPFDYQDPYNEVTAKEHTILGPSLKWGANVAGSWYADPLVLAGKGIGLGGRYLKYGKLTKEQRARVYADIVDGEKYPLGRSPQSRTDAWIDWVEGKNSLGRRLEAPEILHGTPELKKYAAEPHVIAGLVADTKNITNPLERRDAVRRILAVAAGDTTQINRLRAEVSEAAGIGDALANMAKGGTLDLKLLAAAPTLRTDPRFVAHLENQLKNLNKDGAVDKFIDGWTSRIEQQLGTQRTMGNLPGAHLAGDRAINRLNNEGALRAASNTHKAVDEWAASFATRAPSTSSVFQKGAYRVPLVAVKSVGLLAAPYTKAPVAISDALRRVQFTGIAHLDDWGGASAQLDAMMQVAKVPYGERWKTLSEVYLAKSEPEKARIIEQVEHLSAKSIAREYSAKYGTEIDEDFITGLMVAHAAKRGSSLAHLRGRAYAATEMPEEMLATRAGSMSRAMDEARGAAGREAGTLAAPERKWRVDQINDDGTPLSLPLLEPQLTNSVPLFDVDLARKVMDQEFSRLSRLSRAWKEDALEMGRLSNLKNKFGGTKEAPGWIDKSIEAKRLSMDWLMDAGQKVLRGWKFSVLFRLGYPIRVVMDDHWRIWTQMNAMTFYGENGREAVRNWGYNTFGRGKAARNEIHDLRVRRQEILDELEGESMVSHAARQEDLKALKRGLGGVKGQATKLRKRIEEAETKKSLGTDQRLTDEAARLTGVPLAPGVHENVDPKILAKFRSHEDAGSHYPSVLANGDNIEPLTLHVMDGAKPYLYDGNHRLNAALAAGKPVTVEVVDLQARAGGVSEIAAAWKRAQDSDTPDNLSALRERLAQHEATIADREAAIANKLEELGDYGPAELQRELAGIEDEIRAGMAGRKAPKRTIGSQDVQLDDGVSVPGAFAGPKGAASYEISRSGPTFEAQIRGVEDRTFQAGMRGSHRTIQSDEPGHLDAWADALNYQIRQSEVAMHFLKGGDVESFVKWVKAPEQSQLRQRLSHFAHDPEDWGHRVDALVHDYVPDEVLRKALVSGRVSARQLGKMFADQSARPAVHGRSLADNLGTSGRTLGISKVMNRLYKVIGEMPTDHLSRHPFFNSMYRIHAREVYATKKAGLPEDHVFTQQDLADVERAARKLALFDLRRTLFDISAHSHAAHVMRFISPFFAAHQEALSRWWRIVGDDPSVVRRFTLAFDLPRHLGLVVDEDGNLVKPGDTISYRHRVLLQLPKEFGGSETDPDKPGAKWSEWGISENAFNLVLQSGVTNPGAGPLVAVPMAYLSEKYAEEPEIAAFSRVFNPYPPNSPLEAAMPAVLKRFLAMGVAAKENPDMQSDLPGPFGPAAEAMWKAASFIPKTGVGVREYNFAYAQHIQDAMVKFRLDKGREPNKAEAELLMERAGRETGVQMFHRVLWNAASPAPAMPNSKYSVVQHGWYRIAQQAQAEGRDFDWAYAQFKEKWGEAYMPLVYSSANNPAHLEATPSSVAGIKKYKGILGRIDPSLSRMVIGSYAEDLVNENAAMGEYSPEARAFLRDEQIKRGSGDNYFSYDDPRTAMEEQMARRGWQKYGELTASLTALAESKGLASYMESDALMEVKRLAVERLRQDNWAFDKDYGNFDSTQYDRYVEDMRQIVRYPSLSKDLERTDIATLDAYLQLRDTFVNLLNRRKEMGIGGSDAQANEPVRRLYTTLVGRLVESNTYFETYMFNGIVERDPLLIQAGE